MTTRAAITELRFGLYLKRADGTEGFLTGSAQLSPAIDLDEVRAKAAKHVHGLIEEAKLLQGLERKPPA